MTSDVTTSSVRSTRRARIIFYAVDGLGLGHVVRLLAIARAVRQRLPAAEIIFITSSEGESVIYQEGFAAFKVPSRTLRARVGLRADTYLQLVHTTTWNLVSAFNPHLLVVDTFPAGSFQELIPVLRWPLRKAFIFREQRTEAASDPFFQQVLGLYDHVVIPHREGEAEIPLPVVLPVTWAGPIAIRSPDEVSSRELARADLGLDSSDLACLISFGGGGDRDITECQDAAIAAASKLPAVRLFVAAGPLAHPRRWPAGVTEFSIFPTMQWMRAFDFAIAAAGYNTVAELQACAVPTILVPLSRQLDDQQARALRAQSLGWAIATPTFTAGDDLAADLATRLARVADPIVRADMSSAAARLSPPDGAARAADALVALVG